MVEEIVKSAVYQYNKKEISKYKVMFWYIGWLFVLLIVLSVAGIVYASVKDIDYTTDYSSLFVCSFVTLLMSFVFWISMAIWNSGDHRLDNYNEQSVISDTTFIKSASLNSELSGTFFLGIGAIDNEDIYKFYEIVSESSYKLMTLPVKTTRIPLKYHHFISMTTVKSSHFRDCLDILLIAIFITLQHFSYPLQQNFLRWTLAFWKLFYSI